MSDSSPPSEAAAETKQFVPKKRSAVIATDSLAAGTTLGHYVIKKYIGGGGMGRVYLATDAALDRDVAIKVLPQQHTTNEGMIARFMNEAKSAARLNHEHIAQIYFAGEEEGIPFIAFEYVEGINVRTMVEEHDVFPLAQALNYLLQISHALAHAATHNVVHRDVKPSNILITREGRAKLIDMGLARLLDTSEARGDLTASGVTLGTFDYISPEQARDPRNADIRSDLYSLGCTLFYMLAGRPPFPEGTVLQKLLQHQGDAPPDIRSFQPAIPAEISFLIQKMMAKDPKQRFQTPTVLIEALTDVAHRLGLHQAGKGNLVWAPIRTNRVSRLLRHIPWLMAVSLLLFGFLLMTLFSEQLFKPLSLPDPPPPFVPAANPIVEVPSPPVEPVRPTVPFNVEFVSHTAPQSEGLRPPRVGGRLRPALEGVELFNSQISGRFSVTDIEPMSSGATGQLSGMFSNRRIVDPMLDTPTPGSYTSLASALIGIPDNTVIELKWDGTRSITEPIRLDQRNLRFTAATGYAPILVFEPSALRDSSSFFTVLSSDIRFEEVGIEFRLNPGVRATHWSLFELAGNTKLAFSKCFLTVRNKSEFDDTVNHGDVVFFRNSIPASGAEETPYAIEETFSEPLKITIVDSFLRGEAAAIESKVPQDIYVECTNSIIALAKPFFQAEESRQAVRQAVIEVQWNGVVFFGHQGVFELLKEVTDLPMIVEFRSQESVFVLNRSPFVFFRGVRDEGKTLREFRWSGGVNNYFQGVLGLRFRTSSPLDLAMTYEMPLDVWRSEHWTQMMKEQTQIDVLFLNAINKPVSRYLPRDIRLPYPMERISFPEFDHWFPARWNRE